MELFSPEHIDKIKIQVCREPVYHLIIDGLFGKENTDKIIQESLDLKRLFKPAVITEKHEVDEEYRKNETCFLENVYTNDRELSDILMCREAMIKSQWFKEMMASAPFPLNQFTYTTKGDTQLSRYNEPNSHYNWHLDGFDHRDRVATISYYVCSEPKKFEGGNLQITNGLISKGKIVNTVDEKPLVKEIEVKNDRAVIFYSQTPHCVTPIKESVPVEDARLSIQMWFGFQ